jgi:SP family general alpha glucoside:H+ symporter-like MFS transporter
MTDEKVIEPSQHHEVAGEGQDDLKADVPSEQQQSVWQEIKSNPRVIAYSVLANSGSLAFGFDILVTGAVTALPSFRYCSFSVQKI